MWGSHHSLLCMGHDEGMRDCAVFTACQQNNQEVFCMCVQVFPARAAYQGPASCQDLCLACEWILAI